MRMHSSISPIFRTAAAALTIALVACSGGGQGVEPGLTDLPTAPRELPPLEGAELYLSKRAIKDVEFEQYKVAAGKIFRECGKVRRGRYITEKQDIFDVSQSDLEPVTAALNDFYRALESSKAQLEEPGTGGAVWDPGQLALIVTLSNRNREFKTSVDSIVSPNTEPEEKLKEVVIQLREVGKGGECPNPKFFGIASRIERPEP